jgi:hypothetical protein
MKREEIEKLARDFLWGTWSKTKTEYEEVGALADFMEVVLANHEQNIALLRAVIQKVEWHFDSKGNEVCSWCFASMGLSRAHKPDCLRQAALAASTSLDPHTDVQHIVEENHRLRAALQEVEWTDVGSYTAVKMCPWCAGVDGVNGHKPNCQRQAALGVK